jgi:D-alanyl-D-alanine carboxypeptidase
MRKWSVPLICLGFIFSTTTPANAILIPKSFETLASSPFLFHPGIILVNPATSETVFTDAPDVTRAPASVLKLVSMTTAIEALGADTVFHTSISTTSTRGKFAMIGDGDPWITTSSAIARKFHRALSTTLITAALRSAPKLRTITIDTNGVYLKDLQNLKYLYRKKVNIKIHQVATFDEIRSEAETQIREISSPPLSEIVQFTLLWSDNVLADRLARTAAKKLGFGTADAGIQQAFEETLKSIEVPAPGLSVFDGNGLSHEDRISARTIADLLIQIKNRPELKVIYDGLPLAGETGTLKNRFTLDAPTAVGLIKAKTGWIDTTVSLAGYVDVGPDQYVFAVIADHIKPYERYRQIARKTIDRMLGTIALPPPVTN